MRRIAVGLLIIGVTLGLAPGGSATAGPRGTTGHLVRVSGPSPFAGCPSGGLDERLPEGAVEPSVAANPTNRDNIVAVWPQDRYRGLVAGVTFDGGRTWRHVVIPGATSCTRGSFDYINEAWAAFGHDGVLHVSATVYNADASASGRIATRSTNGGLTWSRPQPLVTEPTQAEGKYAGGSTVTDPSEPNLVYSVTPKFPTDAHAPSRSRVAFIRSHDGGRTWEPARQIFDTGQNGLTSGHQILVLPDHSLVDVFTLIDLANESNPHFHTVTIRSRDRGQTWSSPSTVGELRSLFFFSDPETGDPNDPWTGDPVSHTTSLLSDTAVDPVTGRIYVVWQDSRWSNGPADGIALSSSADGGRTWTEPVKANVTPTNIPIRNQQAFTPAVDVAADGTVAVSYSDFRNNDNATPLWTDRWVARCRPSGRTSCTLRGQFGKEDRLTETSFDMRQAPNVPRETSLRGFFLGNYMGLTHTGRDFVAVFAQPWAQGPPAVFARRVRH
jgi:hypothetical protein